MVVCTRNRAHLLPRLLDRLAEQAGSTSTEILVVDNGSTDDTAEVVARADLGVSYVFEAEPGLSRARNRGIRESHGEVVLFIDDDALPLPGWLDAHRRAFEDATVGAVGGPIALSFEGQNRPRWLTEAFEQLLGAYDLGPDAIIYGEHGYDTLSGGNMSFRRRMLDEVGLFDVALGRRDEALLAGEEYELTYRLLRAGWKAVYEPRAAVVHLVVADRLRVAYFRSRLRSNVVTGALLAERGFVLPGHYARARHLVANLVRDGSRVFLSAKNGDRLYHALRVEAHLLGARSSLTRRGGR
jgi:glycosyltransferase involved in cell wall biosynthesis